MGNKRQYPPIMNQPEKLEVEALSIFGALSSGFQAELPVALLNNKKYKYSTPMFSHPALFFRDTPTSSETGPTFMTPVQT